MFEKYLCMYMHGLRSYSAMETAFNGKNQRNYPIVQFQ